jgi:hypothetical protein
MRVGKWRRPGKSMWAGNELGMERNESENMKEAWKIHVGWK